jgi:hypothetical protein
MDVSGNSPDSKQLVVQFCPYCAEPVGSFWGRREATGSLWCESCAVFFRVTIDDESDVSG